MNLKKNLNVYIDENYTRVICVNCELPTETTIDELKKVGGNAQFTCNNCGCSNLYILARKLIGSKEYEPKEETVMETTDDYENTSGLDGFEF